MIEISLKAFTHDDTHLTSIFRNDKKTTYKQQKSFYLRHRILYNTKIKQL